MPDTHQDLQEHCYVMIRLLAKGRLIPFFGAGANQTNRPANTTYNPRTKQFLPTAEELSEHMANEFKYPWERDSPKTNLLRVSWYTDAKIGRSSLYDYLHGIFNADYPLTKAHEFFASLPGKLEEKGYPRRPQLILTTNYDDLLERACEAANEPYDVLSYVAAADRPRANRIDKRKASKFRYTPYGGTPDVIKLPNEFLPANDRTTILKIHGAVDRSEWDGSSFVITEDDYLDYLSHMKGDEIPSTVIAMMRKKSFLFLGYSLGDWNLRVLLKSVSEQRQFQDQSWAIMKNPKEWDADYWDHHNVQLRTLPLEDYIQALTEQLESLPPFSG